jgi:hypothetical protein
MDNLDHVRAEVESLLGAGRDLSDRVRDEELDPREVIRGYQDWYTATRRLVAHVLPDRRREFEAYYRSRHADAAAQPTIAAILVGWSAAKPASERREGFARLFDSGNEQRAFLRLFDMQLAILASALPTLLPAERPYDRELELAHELLKAGHRRAAGALAGMALEQHLRRVARHRGLELAPGEARGAAPLNRELRAAGVYGGSRAKQIRDLIELSSACQRGTEKPSPQRLARLLAGVDDVLQGLR